MNLGVTHEKLGNLDEAGRYYQQSRDVYQEIGDQRRAAEQEYNAAALLATSNPTEALRRLTNARATFKSLGYVVFEVDAMQAQAESLAALKRFDESLRLLREASNIAQERHLKDHLAVVKMSIGNVQILQGDYKSAVKTLEEVVGLEEAPAEAQISLGRAYLRLGDLESARNHLERGLALVRQRGETRLVKVAEDAIADLTKASGETPRNH